jgi:Hydantoinase/oxoprolinase N-terminal region
VPRRHLPRLVTAKVSTPCALGRLGEFSERDFVESSGRRRRRIDAVVAPVYLEGNRHEARCIHRIRAEEHMGVRIGTNTGGTFTDLIGLDESTGELVLAKTPLTPSKPVNGMLPCARAGSPRVRCSSRYRTRIQEAGTTAGQDRPQP